ncbi:MAG: FlgD immunoglobulin-like domain containing protein [bacterium]
MKSHSRNVLTLLTAGAVGVLVGFSLLLATVIPATTAQNTSKTGIKDPFNTTYDREDRPGNLDPETAARGAGSNISVTVTVTSLITGNPSLPERFSLAQNFPNPFNSTTSIEYDLPISSDVTIDLYNMLGQKVRTLVDGYKAAGYYTVEWDGKTSSGRAVATGVYLYRIQAGSFVKTKKMILLK